MRWRWTTTLCAGIALLAASCGDDSDEVGVADDPPGDDRTGETYDPLEPAAPRRYTAELMPVNGSGITGRATVDVDQDGMTVTIESRGFDDQLPHAQHIHARGAGGCPPPSDADEGVLSTPEGGDAYGPAMVSLTTEGDVGPDSRVALDRFPSPVEGAIGYARTFDIPRPLQVSDLTDAVIVQHGLPDHEGGADAYDGVLPSPLDPSIPLEATLPVSCGPLVPAER